MTVDYLYLLAITLVLHRGTHAFLSLFDSTRYMIKMILECFTSMIPFTAVTMGLMTALSVSYFQLKKIEVNVLTGEKNEKTDEDVRYEYWGDKTWINSIGFSYDMLIGQPEEGFEKLTPAAWCLYIFGTFV